MIDCLYICLYIFLITNSENIDHLILAIRDTLHLGLTSLKPKTFNLQRNKTVNSLSNSKIWEVEIGISCSFALQKYLKIIDHLQFNMHNRRTLEVATCWLNKLRTLICFCVQLTARRLKLSVSHYNCVVQPSGITSIITFCESYESKKAKNLLYVSLFR